jgi:hypothetical protein
MIRPILALLLALAAPTVSFAQPQPAAPALWRASDDRTTFTTTGFSFPRRIGALRLTEAQEFSHQGQGVDNVLKYASPDQQVFATVYIYLPGLAHGGLTAVMTDQLIRQQSEPEIRVLNHGSVAVGGLADRAIRADYSGYRHNLASSAAYIKAGRWIVKVRVSGPQRRQAEIQAAMSALLEGMRFEGAVQPYPAALLSLDSCADAVPGARPIADSDENVMNAAIIAAFDAAGEEARTERGQAADPVLSRIGTRWCQTRVTQGEVTRLILRAAPGAGDGLGGRTVMLVPVNDAGTTLEMVETSSPRRFLMLYHRVGETAVLGQYDATLSDEQILAILDGSDPAGGRFRATIEHRPGGGTNINLPQPSAEGRPPATSI